MWCLNILKPVPPECRLPRPESLTESPERQHSAVTSVCDVLTSLFLRCESLEIMGKSRGFKTSFARTFLNQSTRRVIGATRQLSSCDIAAPIPHPSHKRRLKRAAKGVANTYETGHCIVCMCCSPANSDPIHYQFIYSLPELLRAIHQTRAPYVTMGRSNDLPRPEPRAKSPEKAMSTR